MTSVHLLLNNQPIAASSPSPTITEWRSVEFTCTPPPGATLTLSIGGPGWTTTLQPFLRPGDTAWYWQWNPQNSVGRVLLTLCVTWPDATSEETRIALEIVPRKIDQERYTHLLDDLHAVIPRVMYALAGATAGARLQSEQASNAAEPGLLEVSACFCDKRLVALEQAVQRIAHQPHTVLRSTTERVETGRAASITQPVHQVVNQPPVQPLTQALPLPAEITQQRSIVTTDTPENRLVLRLLYALRRRASLLTELAVSAGEPAIAKHSRIAVRRIDRLCSLPFLAEVTGATATSPPPLRGPTHHIQRNPSYRLVYRLWQELRRDPLFAEESDLLHLPIAELPRLYEWWCVVQVVHALLELPGVVVQTQALVEPATGGRFRLVEGTPLLLVVWQGRHIRLRYQPRYQPIVQTNAPTLPGSLDSHTHIPDMALEVAYPDRAPTVIVLDAKYRLSESGEVPADALADAYTYLGSIGLPTGERATRAVLLLYPGEGTGEHYASGVSLVPLLPGGAGISNLLAEVLVR